jgi:hypothetical protein
MWNFGMKPHVDTETPSRVHSLATPDSAATDTAQLPALLHGEKTTTSTSQSNTLSRGQAIVSIALGSQEGSLPPKMPTHVYRPIA